MVAPHTPSATTSTNRRSLAAIVALALVAATAFTAAQFHDDGPQYPDSWDPRVADLVDFVETTRGLDFDHPVRVYFLTEAEYTAAITGGDTAEPTAADRDDAARQVAMLRALGVVEGEPDLLRSSETIADSGTLAFYDTDRDVVNVRGEDLTVGLRVTLVHELTHTLQDQHFDVVELVDSTDPEASAAARSIVEGDAVNVEQAYVAELPDDEATDYDEESTTSAEGADEDLGDVPDFLTTVFAAPYYFGPSFMSLFGSDADGNISPSKVDAILERPPLTMGHLFDAHAQVDGVAVAAVSSPQPDTDAFDRSTIGTVVLYSMLASRIDPVLAMDATDGWRGDSYRADEDADDVMCVDADFAMATPGDATQLSDALGIWSKQMPVDADVKVEVDADGVTLHTCDPGADAELAPTTDYGDALILPVVRLQFAFGQTIAGVDLDAALCVSDHVVRELTIDELNSEELTPELEQRLVDLTGVATDGC